MNKNMIKEFLSEYEENGTLLNIEINIGNNDITIVADNEMNDMEDGFLTVFIDTNSIELTNELYEYLKGIKKENTKLQITTN
ncbi:MULTISPECIES: hypothetical protein [unclassified Collinsella]|uniref:hypothetical protein n=2 Tax=unclassified Collinsella TaxID=2637548 RepID=UPI003F93D782